MPLLNTQKITFSKSFWFIVLALFATIGFIVYVFPNGFVDESGAIRALRQAGYTEIIITGWRPFIGQRDFYTTGFSAISPNGQKVTGVVTGNDYGGNTIRTD